KFTDLKRLRFSGASNIVALHRTGAKDVQQNPRPTGRGFCIFEYGQYYFSASIFPRPSLPARSRFWLPGSKPGGRSLIDRLWHVDEQAHGTGHKHEMRRPAHARLGGMV